MMENYQDTFAAQQAKTKAQIERARQMQQYNAPKGPGMVGNIYVPTHPLQYAAELLRNYQGKKLEQEATSEFENVSGQRNQKIVDALRGYTTNMMGAPEQRTPMQADAFDEADRASLGGNQNLTAVTPERKADPRAAYASLLASPDEAMRTAGMTGMARIPEMEARQQELQETRQARIDAAAQAHQDRMAVLEANNASAAARQKEQQDFLREMKRMSGGGASSQPYFQPVQTGQGVMAFNARTGRVEPVMGADGKPIVGAAADPALQGQLAGAKTTGTRQAESIADARGDSRKADMFLQQLTQAEDILKQGPTASGVGAAVDAAGRLVGASTPGAQRAGQLESLSGWLVANVPRMEGPQSNFDVQNYMTMAGKIGDRTTPVPERMAALQEVRRLQEKYKASADSRMGGQTPSATPQNAPQTRPNAAPQVGTVQNGYVFLGGDPSKPTSWRQQ